MIEFIKRHTYAGIEINLRTLSPNEESKALEIHLFINMLSYPHKLLFLSLEAVHGDKDLKDSSSHHKVACASPTLEFTLISKYISIHLLICSKICYK